MIDINKNILVVNERYMPERSESLKVDLNVFVKEFKPQSLISFNNWILIRCKI